MTDSIRHRGPDGEGFCPRSIDSRHTIGLAHRRLAIIDLADAATSRCANEDGRRALIFNGEIYNFIELRRELEAPGPPLPHPVGHRGSAQRLCRVGPGLRRAAARHVRLRAMGPAAPASHAGARPFRQEAALHLSRARRKAAVRLARSRRCSPSAALRPRSTAPRIARLSRLSLRARRPTRCSPACASSCPAATRCGRTGELHRDAFLPPPYGDAPTEAGPPIADPVADFRDNARRGGAHPHGERRAVRRLSLGRDRQLERSSP